MTHPHTTLDTNVIDLWKKYEDVAMHFNDLIMRWRLQAIGGLAGLVTLAGFVVGDAATLAVRYRAMVILSGVLSFAWIGVGLIDLFYYRRLLQGAVRAILLIERDNPRIALSTLIENEAASASTVAPWVFYGCGLVPLLTIMIWAMWQLVASPLEQPAAV